MAASHEIAIETLIRSRRTTKKFNGEPVSKVDIARLLELVVWAPNHRLTEPWKFRVLTQSGTKRLAAYLKEHLSQDEIQVFQKNLEKWNEVGALIYITSQRDENEVIEWENYAATAAGVQNLLLAATAMKIQTYWGTGKLLTHFQTQQFLKIEPSERFVGALTLGFGEIPEARTRIPASEKTIWFE